MGTTMVEKFYASNVPPIVKHVLFQPQSA